MSAPRFSFALALLTLSAALPAQDRFIVVADSMANRLLAVNPINGVRMELSGPGRGAGPALISPQGIAWHPDRPECLYVVCTAFDGEPSVVEVQWGTGDRDLVSSDDRGDGPNLDDPRQIVILSDGDTAVVADDDVERLFFVDLDDGDRAFFDDGGINRPRTLGVDEDDNVFTNERAAEDDERSAVLGVRPDNGNIFLVWEFPSNDDPGSFDPDRGPLGIFVEDRDEYLVTFDDEPGILLLEPLLDDADVVSAGDNFDGDDRGTGPDFDEPVDLVLADDGDDIFLADIGYPAIFQVDRSDGDRTILSDNGDPGPALVQPLVLTLGPEVPPFTPTDLARDITGEDPFSLVERGDADINFDGVITVEDIVLYVNLGL